MRLKLGHIDWLLTLRRNIVITILAYAIMGFFAMFLSIKTFNPLLNALKGFSFTDIYYSIQAEAMVADTSQVLTIVDMTSIYRRGAMAQVLEDIEAGEPKAVGVDVVFDIEKDDIEGNDSLILAVTEYDNIIFSFKFNGFDDEKGEFSEQIHSFFSRYVSFKEGFCNVARGSLYDSTKRTVFRRTTSDGVVYPSFTSHVFSEYVGREMWNEGEEEVSINFSPRKFVVLQPDEVRSHPELIRGRIVLVGAMQEAADTHWTPIGKIPGVELLAYSIVTLLEKKEVHSLPRALGWCVAFLISLVLTTFYFAYKEQTSASRIPFVRYLLGSSYIINIITFLFSSLLLGVNYIIFTSSGLSINMAWPLSSLAFIDTSRNMMNAISDYMANRKTEQQKNKK